MAKITTQANGIRSQKRTKISLSNNQRIGASNSRRQRRKFHRSGDDAVSSLSFTSSRNSRRAMKVTPASRIEIISATRTPAITPKRSIKIPPISGNGGADEREGGRERETGPGEKQEHSGNDRAPMRNQQDECIASNRNEVEGDESAPVSPTIGEHSSGIGIDRADQSAQSVVKTNDEDTRAKSLEIFRNDSHP